jgi:ribosomal protein S18 acetylase RimI-like enzyme
MIIRQFTIADASAVIALWQRAGLRVGRSDTPERLQAIIERDPDLFLVAEASGEIVGVVLGRYDGRRGWINRLAVEVDYCGHGIGSQLLQCVEDGLRARGCDKVNLHIVPENQGLQTFYEQLGYHREELIFMEKWLVEP